MELASTGRKTGFRPGGKFGTTGFEVVEETEVKDWVALLTSREAPGSFC